ncbi:MAG: hypothetical protein IKG23_04565 [Clostridia bacterium]|nr:hypothetical protein [Clostridia bacterium]
MKDMQNKKITELTPEQMDKVSGGILNIQSDDYLAQIVLDTLDDRDHPDSQGKVSGNPLPERPPF